jgi:WD40 repeat protein
VCITTDGRRVVYGTEESIQPHLYEIATQRLCTPPAADPAQRVDTEDTNDLQGITSLCISPDGDRIFSGSADMLVHVWDFNLLTAQSKEEAFKVYMAVLSLVI